MPRRCDDHCSPSHLALSRVIDVCGPRDCLPDTSDLVAGPAGGGAAGSDEFPDDTGLFVARLGGGTERVRAFGRDRLRLGQVAFDGRRVAWAERRVLRRRASCPDGEHSMLPRRYVPVGPRRIGVRRL